MFERISVSLFHPRMIGKFINDKMRNVIFYFLFLTLVATLPSIMLIISERGVGAEFEKYFIEQISKSETKNLTFENKKLTGDSYTLKYANYIFVFGDPEYSGGVFEIVFMYLEDEIKVLQQGITVNTTKYEDLEIGDFTLSAVREGIVTAQYRLTSLLNYGYDSLRPLMIPVQIITTIFVNIIMFSFMICIIYFFSRGINPGVTNKMRLKICIYSMTWVLIISAIAGLYGLTSLLFIAIIIPYIFVMKALSSIVKIEVKK